MAILVMAAIVFLCLLANLVLYIIVLIKLFKKEGPILGIVGILCGFFTFIWGWIKHKQLELTKIMLIWTITIIVPPVLAVGIPFLAPGVNIKHYLSLKSVPGITQKPAEQVRIKKAVPRQKISKIKRLPAKATAPKKAVDYDAEIKKVDDLIKKDSKNIGAFYNRGWMYASKGDVQKAIADYSQVIEIDEEFGDAYYNRGLLYAKMKRDEQAVRDFSKAIEFDSRAFDAYCNRGNIHFKMGKGDLAIKDYTAALKIKPNDGELYHNRGIVYLSIGKKSEAAADSKKAAQLLGKVEAKPLKPSSVAWRKDLKGVKIPDVSARGMIHGEVFFVESSKIENGILTIRDGKDFFPDHAVTIFLFLKGESPDGKSYDIASTSGFGSPHIHMKWRPKNSKTPKSRVFMKGYSMRLEFGKTQDGKLPGKIYLCMPDEMKSYLAGSFTAIAKKEKKTKRPTSKE
ncbi:MAG: tetratricopeptide repeat protein [Desulfobacteraceae bacterium]|nr:tetratricopeptide repeat protein [Desulfobacteraceae bacterium]